LRFAGEKVTHRTHGYSCGALMHQAVGQEAKEWPLARKTRLGALMSCCEYVAGSHPRLTLARQYNRKLHNT
jgi:hypothetical protein